MNPLQYRIVAAFWHRGRGTFVPLTAQEVVSRARVGMDEFMGQQRGMRQDGMIVVSQCDRGRDMTYELSDIGKALYFGSLVG